LKLYFRNRAILYAYSLVEMRQYLYAGKYSIFSGVLRESESVLGSHIS